MIGSDALFYKTQSSVELLRRCRRISRVQRIAALSDLPGALLARWRSRQRPTFRAAPHYL